LIHAGKSLVTNYETRKRDSSGNKKRIFTVPAAVVLSNQAAVEEAIDAAIVKEVAMEVEADQTERINIQEVDQIQMKNAIHGGISGASATRILEATIITCQRKPRRWTRSKQSAACGN
jgi:hypothetical protein